MGEGCCGELGHVFCDVRNDLTAIAALETLGMDVYGAYWLLSECECTRKGSSAQRPIIE